MDIFKNNQFIVDFYYNNPHQCMLLTEILNHAVEHNTWNITRALLHLQVEVVT